MPGDAHRVGAALIAALRAPADAPLLRMPLTAVVVAHPDDEVVGAGSRLPRLVSARFVYVTDGAPRDGRDAARHGLSVAEYREARRGERDAALHLCGIGADQVVEFGCVDQEAALALVAGSRRLADAFADWRIEAVLTHAYEGGHPDHESAAFMVHAAAALLRARGQPAPDIVEMTSYHRGEDGLLAGRFLPGDRGELTVDLTPAERSLRRALLDAHATQQRTLRIFQGVTQEGWRIAPAYDFRRRPHAGPLWYEHLGWPMDGTRFCALAAEALAQLALEATL
jgi:LmbE family N-acetylglucosaminyl deacetylase